MKRKILLGLFLASLTGLVQAQKVQKTTAYAITGTQKGASNWSEVRLVDITTGDEVKSIYKNGSEVEILNARTGKPVVKKDIANDKQPANALRAKPVVTITDDLQVISSDVAVTAPAVKSSNAMAPTVIREGNRTIVIRNSTNTNTNTNYNINYNTKYDHNYNININEVYIRSDKPFSTNSAAMAYDSKHERLYYTPMGIAQLRYIDLKSGKIYYFEDEKFGEVKGLHDVQNQITRMVIASDGDGYALTNDGNHLIRFTTGKKPVITDLGALTDQGGNTVSVHNGGGFGGDMIADANKNLYLITANRNVFKISLENKLASYLGAIKGMPRGFSTNGAVVEGGSSVIVSSANNTQGYYRFDLNTLEAEKVSNGASVFNASDLANGVLAFAKEKKKKDRKSPEMQPETVLDPTPVQSDVLAEKTKPMQTLEQSSFAIYPNPVRANGTVKLSFANQPLGKYQIQLIDISGQLISSREVNIGSRSQIEELRIPKGIAKGSYLVKVASTAGNVSMTNTVIVGE